MEHLALRLNGPYRTMHQMRLFSFIITLSIATILFGCGQQSADQQNWVQSILDSYKDSLQSYGIVALVDSGTRKYTASVGFSNSKTPINTNNRFCIGSCTKMYTATLVLKLQEQGLLHINDSIYHYLPRHRYIDSTITIRQLLNHTSGLTDFAKNDFINTPLLEPFGDYSDSRIFSLLDTIDFEKGNRHRYCNTNYFLLRKIIERATDKPYESVLQENIIEPLGLKNTFPYYSNKIESLAHPIIDGQDLQDIPKVGINTISKGIGNIVSDIYDVNKFIRALLIDKTVLQPASLALMSDFYQFKSTKAGLGLFEENHAGSNLWGHTGRQTSYISFAFVDAKTGQSFVILTNNANDEYGDRILNRLCSRK